MRATRVAGLILLLTAFPLRGASPEIPASPKEPFLRLETGGATAIISAMAFSPDGDTLYVAGWDKVIRAWVRDKQSGRFRLDAVSFRVPTGSGLDGAIAAMALSPDGVWLAAGGRMITRQESGTRDVGLIVDTEEGGYSDEMHQDRGLIYLFNTRTLEARPLRGHWGQVLSMAFAPSSPGKPNLLASTSQEWDPKNRKYTGGVRLWDVDKGEEVGQLLTLPDPRNTRPGVSVWHTGLGRSQARVGLAWWDGVFRVWDVERKKDALWEVADGSFNNSVAFVPAPARALTASFAKPDAVLQTWEVPSVKVLKPDAGQRALFPPAKGEDAGVIRALLPVSSKAGGPLDLAAMVFRVKADKGDQYRLRLVDLDGKNFGRERATLNLWKGGERLPVLAAAPGGQHLAVAGKDNSSVQVYKIKDLLDGKNDMDELKGIGRRWPFVAFAVNGKTNDLGIVVGPTPAVAPGAAPRPLAAGDVIFDLAKRSLPGSMAGWKIAAPDAGDWRATATIIDKKAVLTTTRAGREVGRVEMLPGQIVHDFALLPPRKHIDLPLLAVAFADEGRPRLQLYNAQTGDPIRWFTGHADLIRSVAFSPDGRLLATTGDDQTICIWSVANHDGRLGKVGRLERIFVEDRKGEVVVARVDKDSPAAGKLDKGDVIEGVEVGDKFRPFKSRVDYFMDIAFEHEPGNTANLRVRGKGVVKLPVGQGRDERKPLFTLFLSQPEGGQREWIGWHRLGPYDSSGPRAERYVGWHFNTGQPDAPTRFVLANQWRTEFRREGILHDLATEGRLTEALERWQARDRGKALPAPTLSLSLDEKGAKPSADDQGVYTIRQRDVKLGLSLDGDFPADDDKVASLAWQLDGGAAQKFAGAGLVRTADLGALKWERGTHRVRVTLRTNEATPKEYVKELTFRYQPPAPLARLTKPVPKDVTEAALTIDAEVKPGVAGQEVDVTLAHYHGGKAVLEPMDQGPTINRKLALLAGDNEVRIVAVNKGATPGREETETARLALTVRYTPAKMTLPPRILLSEMQAAGETLKIVPGRALVVHTPRVRLVGQIDAEAALTKAALVQDGTAKSLTDFAADKHKTWPIREEVTLEPGPRVVRVVARAGDPETEASLTVDYQPPLPRVELLEPEKSYFVGEDAPEATIKGRLVLPADARPYKATLLVNGKEMAIAPVIDERARTLAATVPLAPGANRVQIKLTNEWKASALSRDVEILYRRAPRNARFDEAAPGPKAFIDLTARVDSALPLLADGVTATVNGRAFTALEVMAPTKAGDETYLIRLKQVPLAEGDNRVSLSAANAEAGLRKPFATMIAYKPPQPPKPPVVEILDPKPGESPTNSAQPVVGVRYRVVSATPLQTVELVRELSGQATFRLPLDMAKAVRKGEFFELEGRTELGLIAGINTLRLEAANDGGKTYGPPLTVIYSPPPVRGIYLDALEAGGQTLTARQTPDGLTFPDAPDGLVRLRGRVVWDETQDASFKNSHEARVYVNGFQQAPTPLRPAKTERTREFEANLVLNRARRNVIEIEVPTVKRDDAGGRTRATVHCLTPMLTQRLHVLIVSPNAREESELRGEVLAAVKGQAASTGLPRSAAFDSIHLYPALIDQLVTPGKVSEALERIEHNIERLQNNSPGSDVLLVYYDGAEMVDADARRTYFTTSVSQRDPDPVNSGVSTARLLRHLTRTRGLPLVLLDVAGAGETPRPASWTHGERLGLLRYAWQGETLPKDGPRLLSDLADATRLASRLGDVAASAAGRFTSGSPSLGARTDGSHVLQGTLPGRQGFAFDGYLPGGGADELVLSKP